MHNGLLPNRFDDVQSKAHYDTADASLWFIHALMQWMQTSGQRDNALLDAAMQVVKHYCAGTDFGIGIHEGLVEAGQDGYALTWMDAKTDEFAITPRVGKPIELSALWHNGLLQLASHITTDRSRLQRCAMATSEAFGAFWNSQTECCFDVLDSGPSKSPDAAIRPNQLFACSVEHSPLSVNQRRSVLRVVQRHLLTPFGLRTLSPQHPDYIGACSGTQAQRDKAYHNGTVWPWLIGPWIDAHVRLGEEATVPSALLDTMRTGCVGQLAEIFDGDAPHTPRGCPAQAWSVAEVLRHTSPVGQACVHETNR
jgi:predicted glycogen debranching enzyme